MIWILTTNLYDKDQILLKNFLDCLKMLQAIKQIVKSSGVMRQKSKI